MMSFHFIGLCGTAMAGVAAALKDLGHSVSGSDAGVYPPMSDYLERHGIRCSEGFDAERLHNPPDIVVIGNAISRGNPEVEYTLIHRLPFVSLPELIRTTLILDATSVVVAGTHGKTTTTAMAAWTLERADRHPGFLIGGAPKNFTESCRPPHGGVFVVEGDEYDSAFFDKRSKFVHYAPDIAVVNNIEFDHADIFRDMDDVMRAFHQLVALVPANGLLLLNGDDAHAASLVEHAHTGVEFFGLGEGCHWRAVDIQDAKMNTTFTVMEGSHRYGRFTLPFPGAFMVRNALAVIGVCSALGLTTDEIRAGLETFEGVHRRMDVLYDRSKMTIIDDFAHHHTAVRETLTALRTRYPGRRLVAAFEPRSNTSTRRVFQDELIAALSVADCIILGPVNRPERYAPDERLQPQTIVDALVAQGKAAVHCANSDEIADYVLRHRRFGDVVVVMSNGDFGGLKEKLLAGLS